MTDPHRVLDDLMASLKRVVADVPLERVEFYARVSTTQRVRFDSRDDGVEVRRGVDEGSAVRIQPVGSGQVHFAAVASRAPEGLRAAVDRALSRPGRPCGRSDPWSPTLPVDRSDHDPQRQLPAIPEFEGWLRRAWSRLAEVASPSGHRLDGVAWVEVAETVESWVSDAGLRASRTRFRGWAKALPGLAPGDPLLRRPLTLAARDWEQLEEGGWSRSWGDRKVADGNRRPFERGRSMAIFGAEAASQLVSALVRSVHDVGSRSGLPAGPGWVVSDAPRSAGSLYGGSFDDSGFPTRDRELANGGKTTDLLTGMGHDRRASFRDPPVPMPSHIVVDAPLADAPANAARISGVAIHPRSTEEWILEVVGGYPDDDSPRAGWIRLAPADLIRCCSGACGPPTDHPLGVRTAPLVFDGVEIEAS